MENSTPQDDSMATFAPKIKKSDSEINWSTDSSLKILRKFRAFGEKIPPRSVFIHNSKPIDIQLIDISPEVRHPNLENLVQIPSSATPGTIFFPPGKKPEFAIVVCADKTLLVVSKVKVQGKSVVAIKDFINGYYVKSGLSKFMEIQK
ncbi:Methionyl-tRNA formyltransferase, mitochondrial [Smittium culicis]|uniref:Methionyl-tRNA formyltransferase, mitochondrial n=1 Tax=Smittium culicis TaxID=133412 RepID=A0A1R1Y931_9FUNG|nr:Methionyl-tRNA formyltransferase, mitochondrial [Smittium culicis]